MTQCWSEGELRAYLDGELPARDVERVAGHVKDCEACARVCAELAGRSARIAAWLEILPEPRPPLRIPAIPQTQRHAGGWVAAAGLAAALAVALMTVSVRQRPGFGPIQMPIQIKSAQVPQAPVVSRLDEPLPNGRGSERVRASRDPQRAVTARRATPLAPKPRVESYVALDDEPIEAGVVVRVGLGGGQVPADVIFGPDGRARAIRLISDVPGEK